MRVVGLCLAFSGLCPFTIGFKYNSAHAPPQALQANTSSPLVDFQVYKPVEFDPPSKGCDQVLLLVEHQFAFSYGLPFVGRYLRLVSMEFAVFNAFARKLYTTAM
jgi:hypothetical protein